MTRAHASVITELPGWEMGAVLAGLTKASERLRESSGATGVQVRAHPTSNRASRGHLHFRLMPESPEAQRAAYEAFDSPSVFESLVDTISH